MQEGLASAAHSARLDRAFFERPTVKVAQALIGQTLVFGLHRGVITETEAYVGEDDPACHAARGKTRRTAVMFGPAGVSYVYLIYGMYHCLNIVTEREGFPAAVLIRGVRMLDAPHTHHDGPGKLCRTWNITRAHNAVDMIASQDFYVESGASLPCVATPRIGIKVGTDRLWRFVEDTMLR